MMQAGVVALADAATAPYLLIVEAAMGDGKTEAALYALDRALSIGLARGFYVALPTQATGNAMFERVRKYLAKRGHGGPLNLQLVHAGALLSESYESLRRAADALHGAAVYDDTEAADSSAEAEGSAGRVVAEGWFAARKRPLLARFGVGTIDQSLLGVLQTKHWFIRLAGLAGKVIVFDEVHAYDVYMSELLCLLLRWLRALDCTVILLSATLPAAARAALVTAWHGDAAPADATPYPRLTFCPAGGRPETQEVADAKAPVKSVALIWEDFDWGSVLKRLRGDLPDGGCALLLCNTVTRAQEAFRTLSAVMEGTGWEVRLFHARTPAGWRQEREDWVLKTFGKSSPADRRGAKVLLIATQVVEQSLDLDFDWIASEMAPADLLLQRMGRLWRHPDRLRATDVPRFVVLCGLGAECLPRFPDYAELIYERYVLLRSWLALRKRGEVLALPAAIDPLVQEVYDVYDSEAFGELSPVWREALAASHAERLNQQGKDRGVAATVTLPVPSEGLEAVLNLGDTLDHTHRKLWDEEDPRIHETVRAATRLGDPSIGVICTGTGEGGQPLAEVPTGEPSLEAVRSLLRFGLSLSNRGLYKTLATQDAPSDWRDSALLRYHRVLEFRQGRLTLDQYALRLSRDEGLVIEKQGREDEK